MAAMSAGAGNTRNRNQTTKTKIMKIKPTKKLTKAMREVDVRKEPSAATALFKAARKLPAIRLKRILATTDFSEVALDGVRLADWVAERFSAHVLLAHVVEPPSLLAKLETVDLAWKERETLKLAETQLVHIATRELRKGPAMAACVRHGKAFHEIVTLAGQRHMDLIVIATRGQTGWTRVWLGSTAERVVRHAPCPVLTVPPRKAGAHGQAFPPVRLKRIVVPVDFSEVSVQALPYAAAFAQEFDAEIILLHVWEPRFLPPDVGSLPPSVDDREDDELTVKYLKHLRHEALDKNLRVRTLMRNGVPFQQITRVATSLDADLIILTTHGHTGLKHVFLGSTAERVVRDADCPVLVVRGKAHSGREKRLARRRHKS